MNHEDVGMFEIGDGVGFEAELNKSGGVGGQLRAQHFHGHDAGE